MLKFKVKCDWCGKIFKRELRRINESQKNNWRQFCSLKCLRKIRLQRKELTCANPLCNKRFYRPPADIKKTNRSFCSQNCRAVVINFERGVKNQKNCGNPGCCNQILSYKKYCSGDCFQQHRKRIFLVKYKKRVLAEIKKFYRLNKRIPFKQELCSNYRPARIAFGTWNQAIKAAGFSPNQLKFTHKYIANDKHICDSLAEKIIDDWLFARKIKHLVNFPYPGDKRFTVDFKIGSYWLEFFGLSGQLKTYERLKTKKIKLAKKFKLKLIKVYPFDLFPKNRLDKTLKSLLH